MRDLELSAGDGGVTLSVRVKPRSSRSRVLGVREGAVEVALRAAPVDGAANDELLRILAKTFGVSRSQVRVVTGAHGRTKLICIAGTTLEAMRASLADLPER